MSMVRSVAVDARFDPAGWQPRFALDDNGVSSQLPPEGASGLGVSSYKAKPRQARSSLTETLMKRNRLTAVSRAAGWAHSTLNLLSAHDLRDCRC